MEGFVFKTEIKLSQMGNVLDRADRLAHACEADRDRDQELEASLGDNSATYLKKLTIPWMILPN